MITCIIIFSAILFLKNKEYHNYVEKGNKTVKKVYQYKKNHKKLPNIISDFSSEIEMGQGPYYEKLNDTLFNVYFNIGFDDKFIFNSYTKEWK